MPIYEYKCPKCGTFELIQRITEPALKKCPTCKGKVERLMSRNSFVLKGSGWYVTDYARASKSESKDAKGEGKSDSTAKGADSGTAGSAGSGSESAKSDSSNSDTTKSSSSEPAKTSGSEKSAAK
jgi:putative FmdB family regulatory protein